MYEIHIIYFSLIGLFFHLCGVAIKSTLASLAALVASSCLARLYEEMDWRDDIGSLLSVHHWYIMVACIPQIHHSGSIYDHDALCKEELSIFISVLRQMRTKWPAVENLLKKIDRSWNAQAAGLQQAPGTEPFGHGENSTANHDYIPASLVSDLFPFPNVLCPRMALIEQVTLQQEGYAVAAAQMFSDEDLDRIFAEFLG